MEAWFAAQCASGAEMGVANALTDLGQRIFYPFVKTRIYVGRHKKMRLTERALFPGYLFTDNLRSQTAERLCSIVRENLSGRPLAIPSNVMDALFSLVVTQPGRRCPGCEVSKQRLETFVGDALHEHWFSGRPGNHVMLVDDAPFFSLCGRIVSTKDLQRTGKIKIIVSLFGAQRIVSVRAESVAQVLT